MQEIGVKLHVQQSLQVSYSFVNNQTIKVPYILEPNPHLVFAIFLNEKKLVRASNPHLSFNRPLPTGRLFE
jgi:hypothetical protein